MDLTFWDGRIAKSECAPIIRTYFAATKRPRQIKKAFVAAVNHYSQFDCLLEDIVEKETYGPEVSVDEITQIVREKLLTQIANNRHVDAARSLQYKPFDKALTDAELLTLADNIAHRETLTDDEKSKLTPKKLAAQIRLLVTSNREINQVNTVRYKLPTLTEAKQLLEFSKSASKVGHNWFDPRGRNAFPLDWILCDDKFVAKHETYLVQKLQSAVRTAIKRDDPYVAYKMLFDDSKLNFSLLPQSIRSKIKVNLPALFSAMVTNNFDTTAQEALSTSGYFSGDNIMDDGTDMYDAAYKLYTQLRDTHTLDSEQVRSTILLRAGIYAKQIRGLHIFAHANKIIDMYNDPKTRAALLPTDMKELWQKLLHDHFSRFGLAKTLKEKVTTPDILPFFYQITQSQLGADIKPHVPELAHYYQLHKYIAAHAPNVRSK